MKAVYHTDVESALGKMRLTANDTHLTGIYFHGQRYFPAETTQALPHEQHPIFREALRQIDDYFKGIRKTFDLPMNPVGTSFQKRVWEALSQVGFGKTLSYQQLAENLNQPTAYRAVASAVGKNPLSIVIPCHRIIGRDGQLRGYAGGLDKKAYLLTLEGSFHQASPQAA